MTASRGETSRTGGIKHPLVRRFAQAECSFNAVVQSLSKLRRPFIGPAEEPSDCSAGAYCVHNSDAVSTRRVLFARTAAPVEFNGAGMRTMIPHAATKTIAPMADATIELVRQIGIEQPLE
jgi:hypothetical protein